MHEFFHDHKRALPGILLSAIGAYMKNGTIFYFESLPAAIRAIYNSTPFKRYVETPK
ncbi:hypothetical protein D9M70_645310 [compost metagenome]